MVPLSRKGTRAGRRAEADSGSAGRGGQPGPSGGQTEPFQTPGRTHPVSAMISGATYVGVPQTVYRGPSTMVASPKSPSFSDLLPSWCSYTWRDSQREVALPERSGLFPKARSSVSPQSRFPDNVRRFCKGMHTVRLSPDPCGTGRRMNGQQTELCCVKPGPFLPQCPPKTG